MDQLPINIFWFRNDLRSHDNKGLYYSLTTGAMKTIPLFIFDTEILDKLPCRQDKRLDYIIQSLGKLEFSLGVNILCAYGKPADVFDILMENYKIAAVYCNEDYEPYSMARDLEVKQKLGKRGIKLHLFKDSVIFSKNEIVKSDNTPYTVFTPYSKAWKKKLQTNTQSYLQEYNPTKHLNNLKKSDILLFSNIAGQHTKFFQKVPGHQEISFQYAGLRTPDFIHVNPEIIRNYESTRNYPGIPCGTSGLGMHIRFGTVSIREIVTIALKNSDVWLNELIWREFFKSIIYHYPHVEWEPFKKKYQFIKWRNNPEEFEKWRSGHTGYPIVDAGMRQLNQTGTMHNRVRMIAASFLVKHLLIDWRIGERYFAGKLLDYDLSANNGNWQWAAGTGCDAAPYFRIFNPYEQARKFDPKDVYIKQWIPEYGSDSYPKPMCNHKEARERALETYKKALDG